mmetsp:Transcript_28572/g.91070  ORF Transcript_28572/g.91070 Transcript_28572/m.91070 type:complete len:243 (+) Transcript_28572:124-852(+)
MATSRFPAAGLLFALLLLAGRAADAFESDEAWDDDADADADESSSTITVSRRGGGASTASFVLEHSLGPGGQWLTCGRFSARVVAGDEARGDKDSVRLQGLRLAREEMSAEERAAFEALVEADGHYKVRVQSDILEFKPGGAKVMSSVKARCLVDAGMQEHFVLQLDEDGHAVALDHTTPSGDCSRGSDAVLSSDWSFYSSTAAVKYAKDAPRLHMDMMAKSQGGGGGGGGGHAALHPTTRQ